MKKLIKILTVISLFALIIGVIGFSRLFKRDQKSLVTETIPAIDKNVTEEYETATLALGCFWSPDAKFGAVTGVLRTRVGYSGGSKENPTYHNLGDHTETIQIDYDPSAISYKEILNIFWRNHDPTSSSITQYKSVIFYHDAEQKRIASESKEALQENRSSTVVTEITPFERFYLAEDYHQKYNLQQNKQLSDSYMKIYSSIDDFIDSTAVTRANGYIAGYGKIESREDLDVLGLNEEGKELLYNLWSERSSIRSSEYCSLPRSSGTESYGK